MKWKIGDVEIDNQVVLAPMAGICDSAFRRIAKSMGCGLIETEMVSAKSLRYDNRKTMEMLYMTEEERPISQQIFGADSESFRIASKHVFETMKPDIIDINMGCPVTKVAVKSNSGSALLKDPEKIEDIVETVVASVPIPVTVKIRSGWSHKTINALEVAGIVEDAGASAIAVHPRTRQDRYDVPADWSIIKQIKESLSIPVIGNGDIWSCYDAKNMIDETGCDAIMIGRAVRGNPWLIRQCIDYLESGIEPQKVTLDEKITMIRKHVELLNDRMPEHVAVHKMRTHAAYYLKNCYRSSEIKPKLFKIDTKEELYKILEEYKKSIAR
jgi:nifR3 family TIM-barrel protein